MDDRSFTGIQIDTHTAEMLKSAGIFTYERLMALGTEQAYLRIISQQQPACLSLLYKIEGILTGIPWTELPIERMQELNQLYNLAHKGEKC